MSLTVLGADSSLQMGWRVFCRLPKARWEYSGTLAREAHVVPTYWLSFCKYLLRRNAEIQGPTDAIVDISCDYYTDGFTITLITDNCR